MKTKTNSLIRRLSYYKSIIYYIYNHTQASVNEIVKHTNLSQPLIAELLKELSQEGVIQDVGKGISNGGRPPKIYRLVSSYQYVLGIDVNLNHLSIAIFNLNNEIIYRKDEASFDLVNTHEYANKLIKIIQNSLKEEGISSEKVMACGLSLPGLVDAKKGKSITHLSGFKQGISHYMSEQLSFPVLLENDCKMMAMGEKSFGKAKNKDHALCLKIGSGIGLGIVIEGRIYRGADGYAGEFGHILIDPKGDLCHCGKIGCLETFCSGRVLTREINKGLDKGQASILSILKADNKEVDLHQIVNAINQGDHFAIDQLSKSVDYLGKGLVTLIHLFNPDIIILGGKLAHTKKNMIDPLKSSLNKYSMPEFRKSLEVCCSELLDEAVLLGTMAHTMQTALKQ